MQDVTFQETRCRNCRVGQERLLLLVDVNLFVIACNVCERSTIPRQCPRIDHRLKARHDNRSVRNLYIKRAFNDQH